MADPTQAPPVDPVAAAQQAQQEQLAEALRQMSAANAQHDQDAQAALQQMHDQTQGAQQGAQQAGQDYQNATQAPMPQMNPWAQLAGNLLPNVASVVSKNPDYAKQGHDYLEQQHNELLKRRADTLSSLSGQYEQKAEAARQLGNAEAQQRFTELQDKTNRQQQQILAELRAGTIGNAASIKVGGAENVQDKKGQTAITTTKLKGQTAENVAKTGAQAKLGAAAITAGTPGAAGTGGVGGGAAGTPGAAPVPDFIKNATTTARTSNGEQLNYIDSTNLKGAQLKAAMNNPDHIPVLDKDEHKGIQEAMNVSETLKKQLDSIIDKLPKTPGERMGPVAGFLNQQKAFWQSDKDLAAYNAYRTPALAAIPALVKRGLRINVGEIKTLQQSLPTMGDTQDTARQKLATFQDTLDRAMRRTAHIVQMKDKNGILNVPNNPDAIKEAVSHGAVRI